VVKKFLILIIIIPASLYAQNIENAFNQIKNIPCNYYPKEFPKITSKCIDVDSAFKYIVDKDFSSIPWLINKITDTTLTSIKKPGEESYLKKGDLAVILIDHIRLVPWYRLTGGQFDICCVCGALPEGVLSFIDKYRGDFQAACRSYYITKKKKK